MKHTRTDTGNTNRTEMMKSRNLSIVRGKGDFSFWFQVEKSTRVHVFAISTLGRAIFSVFF